MSFYCMFQTTNNQNVEILRMLRKSTKSRSPDISYSYFPLMPSFESYLEEELAENLKSTGQLSGNDWFLQSGSLQENFRYCDCFGNTFMLTSTVFHGSAFAYRSATGFEDISISSICIFELWIMTFESSQVLLANYLQRGVFPLYVSIWKKLNSQCTFCDGSREPTNSAVFNHLPWISSLVLNVSFHYVTNLIFPDIMLWFL